MLWWTLTLVPNTGEHLKHNHNVEIEYEYEYIICADC